MNANTTAHTIKYNNEEVEGYILKPPRAMMSIIAWRGVHSLGTIRYGNITGRGSRDPVALASLGS